MRLHSHPLRYIWHQRLSDFGLSPPISQQLVIGRVCCDFGNDGWPDLLVANGNSSSLMDKLETEVKCCEPLQLFRKIDGKRFEEIATQAGLNEGVIESRYGTAIGDADNDGNVDFVVFSATGPPSLFVIQSANRNHRVLFRMVGMNRSKPLSKQQPQAGSQNDGPSIM